jgi:hypothetical protein
MNFGILALNMALLLLYELNKYLHFLVHYVGQITHLQVLEGQQRQNE